MPCMGPIRSHEVSTALADIVSSLGDVHHRPFGLITLERAIYEKFELHGPHPCGLYMGFVWSLLRGYEKSDVAFDRDRFYQDIDDLIWDYDAASF